MRLIAEPADAGGRLDVWLAGRVAGLSRARAQSLIREGAVRAAGISLTPHTTVRAGLAVDFDEPAPAPSELVPEARALDILYEDSDLLVLNKPAGWVVHPAVGHATGTLVHALLHHCPNLPGIGGEQRPGIVHRLDKDTSGAMVVAKTQAAMDGLAAQFKAGQVHKEYLAVVHGVPRLASERIETLIGRHPTNRKKMTSRPRTGRRAVTRYESIESLGDVAVLRVRIETGRTHQIRVHMAHIGHPVVGDAEYGIRRLDRGLPVSRQMLHARRLAFEHPRTGVPLEFEAPVPRDMAELIACLRQRGTD
jgi:23S rRNA pseudouridine1911/1915/1917 synthase